MTDDELNALIWDAASMIDKCEELIEDATAYDEWFTRILRRNHSFDEPSYMKDFQQCLKRWRDEAVAVVRVASAANRAGKQTRDGKGLLSSVILHLGRMNNNAGELMERHRRRQAQEPDL